MHSSNKETEFAMKNGELKHHIKRSVGHDDWVSSDNTTIHNENQSLCNHSSSPKTIATQMERTSIGVSQYTEVDVLSGRGSAVNTHPGNGYYRYIVNENRRTYLNSKWQQRREIAKSIVDVIRARGGRFLKPSETDNGIWYEIGDKGATDKTTQALRQMKMRRKLIVEDEKINKEESLSSLLSSSQETSLHPAMATGQSFLPFFLPLSDSNFGNAVNANHLWLPHCNPHLLNSGLAPLPPPLVPHQAVFGIMNAPILPGGMNQDPIAFGAARIDLPQRVIVPQSHQWSSTNNSDENPDDERLSPFRTFPPRS